MEKIALPPIGESIRYIVLRIWLLKIKKLGKTEEAERLLLEVNRALLEGANFGQNYD